MKRQICLSPTTDNPSKILFMQKFIFKQVENQLVTLENNKLEETFLRCSISEKFERVTVGLGKKGA